MQLQLGGAHVRPGQGAKSRFAYRHNIVRMHRFDPAALGVNFGQDGPNCGPISTHLAPSSANIPQLGPRSDHLGAIRPKSGSTWLQNGAHGQPNTKSLRLRWAQLARSCRQSIPSMLGLTWTFICITWLQFGDHLDRFGTSAQHDQLATWAPVGSKTAQLGPKLGAAPAQAGPNPGQFADSLHALFPTFLGFDGGSCKAMLPTLGLYWAQLRRQIPVGGKLGPSWSQLTPVRCKFCPSWAQVGSCSAQVKAKDGQV